MPQSIAQKCKAIGISLPTYYQRIAKGMTPEQALSTPPMRKRGKPQPIKSTPKEVDQEPLPPATIQYGSQTHYVFEKDFRQNHHNVMKNAKKKQEQSGGQKKLQINKVNKTAPTAVPVKRPFYGHALDADDCAAMRNFDRVCGGYTATILNHTKDGEFKYQISSSDCKMRNYTNDVVKFINNIIKLCDPEGKTPFRVIER